MRYHCVPVSLILLDTTDFEAAACSMAPGGHADDDGGLQLLTLDFCFSGAGG
jgi:hypothetical protein